MKLLTICVDGLDPKLISKWLKNLPNFKQLVEKGNLNYLESSFPPFSIPAWYWLLTGKQSGKIGVPDFLIRKEGSYGLKFSNLTDVKCRFIWDYLEENFRANYGVVNVPGTFPPPKLEKGFLVSGIHVKNDGNVIYTHPPELSRELDAIYEDGIYEVDMIFEHRYWTTLNPQETLEIGKRYILRRTKAIKYLVNKFAPEFLIVCYTSIDRVTHGTWHEKSILEQIYQFLDRQIGELLEWCEPELVMVISDHGFTSNSKRILLNNWLRNEGYLTLRNEGTKGNFLYKFGLNKDNLTTIMRKLHITSLAEYIPIQLIQMIEPTEIGELIEGHQIDWKKTKAYSYGSGGCIYLNRTSIYPQGTVGVKDVQIEKELKIKLLSIKDENGNKLFRKVHTREELFTGDYTYLTPDLLLCDPDNVYSFVTGVGGNRVIRKAEHTTTEHAFLGTLILSGDGIAKKAKTNARLLDIVPTILHYLGLPLSYDLDGKPLLELFLKHSPIRKRSIRYEIKKRPERKAQASYQFTKEEEEAIEKRLKALGYLE